MTKKKSGSGSHRVNNANSKYPTFTKFTRGPQNPNKLGKVKPGKNPSYAFTKAGPRRVSPMTSAPANKNKLTFHGSK